MYLIALRYIDGCMSYILVNEDIWCWIHSKRDNNIPDRLLNAITKEDDEFDGLNLTCDYMDERAGYSHYVPVQIDGEDAIFPSTKKLIEAIKKHNIDIIDVFEGLAL